MTLGLASSDLGEFAVRVVESAAPNTWMVAVSDEPATTDLARALGQEISALNDGGGVEEVSVTSALELAEAARRHDGEILLVSGVNRFSDQDWQWVDVNRSRLARRGTTVLVLDVASVGRLENLAPNLASWIAAGVVRVTGPKELDAPTIERRLVALRAWAGLGDADVIRLAEERTLPPDPAYAEWLALLGRGELLAR